MHWQVKNAHRGRKFAVAILVIIGGLLAAFLFLTGREFFFVRKAIQAQGEVIDVETFVAISAKSMGTNYVPTIEYEIEGRRFTYRPTTGGFIPYVKGQKVDILYDPSDPDRILLSSDRWLTSLVVFIPFALLFGWLAIGIWRKTSSTLRTFSKLKEIQADIVNVSPPQSGRLYWSVSAVWTDPSTRNTYRFSSTFYYKKYGALNRHLTEFHNGAGQEKIGVAFDPAMPETYYMDIAFLTRGLP